MRDLKDIIADEIKCDMAHKFNNITIELLFQVDNHSMFLNEIEQDKMIQFVNYLQEVIDRLDGEELWKRTKKLKKEKFVKIVNGG